jgi:hypothetical protein
MIWFRRFFRRVEYPKLGRWSLVRDVKVINRKIDLANEDHCGCCVEETKKQPENSKKKYSK